MHDQTRSGKFRGDQKWSHEVGKVRKGQARSGVVKQGQTRSGMAMKVQVWSEKVR